jgi:hypothetical protein
MSDDPRLTLFAAHRGAQEKYDYFLLTAAGASVAFAVNQTQGAKLSWFQVPLAAAVLAWGLSFFWGCIRLRYVDAAMSANLEILRITSGQHPDVPPHPQMIAAAAAGARSGAEHNSSRGQMYARLQFYSLIFGAILFVAWHVLEMAMQK